MTKNQQDEEARLREFTDAAKLLSDEQKRIAMKSLLDSVNDVEAGVIRQILGEPEKSLSPKQQAVYENHIVPQMVEKCRLHSSCKGFTMPGEEYCASCATQYG